MPEFCEENPEGIPGECQELREASLEESQIQSLKEFREESLGEKTIPGKIPKEIFRGIPQKKIGGISGTILRTINSRTISSEISKGILK